MGSLVNVHLCTSPLQNVKTNNNPVYGTFMDGEDISTVHLPKGAILVMGSEGRGIKTENAHLIDHKITIPGVAGKIAESLNVAIATGIICASWQKT